MQRRFLTACLTVFLTALSGHHAIADVSDLQIQSFTRDMSIFDSDSARGGNGADIPISGTTDAEDGSIVEARVVYADSGETVPGFGWTHVATASSGTWYGTCFQVPRNVNWMRIEVRLQDETSTPVQMATRFAVGMVLLVESQSNTHQGLLDNLDWAAQNAVAAGEPFPVTIGNQPGDFQFTWLSTDGNTPQPITYISDLNPHTTSLAAMAETFAKTSPGLKVMIGFDTLSGSPANQPLYDHPSTNRDWSNSVALANILQADGSEVGAVWSLHFQGTTDSEAWIAGAFFRKDVDGNPRLDLSIEPGGFPTIDVGGANINHIWPEIYPGLLTGRTQFIIARQHHTYARDVVTFNNVVGPPSPLMENFSDHIQDVGHQGMLVQPEGDVHWDKADVERGFPQKLRYKAIGFLRAGGGIIDYPLPTIDHVEYTPQHVTIWSDAGPITTIHRAKGFTTNFPVNPNADPVVEGDLEVIGFTNGAQQNVARTQIVDEDGNPATSGRIRIYPKAGEEFTSASQIYYLLDRSGYVAFPGVTEGDYTENYLYDHYPVVDIGVPTIYGQILQGMPYLGFLQDKNDLPVVGNPTLNVRNSWPEATTATSYNGDGGITVHAKFIPNGTSNFEILEEASNSRFLQVALSREGELSIDMKSSTGGFGQLFVYTETQHRIFSQTADGYVDLLIHMNTQDQRVEIYIDGTPYNPVGKYFDGTVFDKVGDFRSGRKIVINKGVSDLDIAFTKIWKGAFTGSTPPATAPWLSIEATADGDYPSDKGGYYDILDHGVSRNSTISDWRMAYFETSANDGNAADTANPTGDGVSNLMKYALGMNPNKPQPSQHQMHSPEVKHFPSEGNVLTYTFTRDIRADGVTLSVEASDSLDFENLTVIDPFNAANQISVENDHPQQGFQTITVRDTSPLSPSRFMRLKVTRP